MTPEFAKRLRRATKLYFRELHDGCADCLAMGKGNYCRQHEKEIYEAILRPRTCKGLQDLMKGKT